MSSCARLRTLWHDRSGVALTEAALILPFILGFGLYGIELTQYALTNMRLAESATQLADNASRIGDTSTLDNRRIYESDINDLLLGADLQAGSSLNLYEHGRVIVSSLEVDESGNQYIHWQRCMGKEHASSSYGSEGDSLSQGMGPSGREVYASQGDAVIFVEIAYDYQPIVSKAFVDDEPMHSISSFVVRSSRDLSQIYQHDPSRPDPVASCDRYENAFA